MKSFPIKGALRLKGEVTLLGDKSLAHRAALLSALTIGITTIENFPENEDCLTTIRTLRRLGIRAVKVIRKKGPAAIRVFGKGLFGLRKPKGCIFVRESGTTFRLLLGVLAGQNFTVTLKAGKSLSQRPMLRVISPLRLMGALVDGRLSTVGGRADEYPPVTIQGGNLMGITYALPVASAQVKSAILLAGLYAKGATTIIEPLKTRDHTERMLEWLGADIKVKGTRITLTGNKGLVSPGTLYVPGDISSAAFFMAAASIIAGSSVVIKNVGLNPTRTGVIKVLKRMGAVIKVRGPGSRVPGSEPLGDLVVKAGVLKGTTVRKKEIPSLIDELPILMVAASKARGKTVFEGVEELRVKETDRVRSMSSNLKKMGADIQIVKTGLSERIVVNGSQTLRGARVKSFGDHRTAMSMAVAGLAAEGTTEIDDIACINKSFPNFLELLNRLTHR